VTGFMSTLQAAQGTAPDLPPGEFDVGTIAEDGTRHRVPLVGAAKVRLTDMAPARRVKARKGQTHLPGPRGG
jgi:hypothetical protein